MDITFMRDEFGFSIGRVGRHGHGLKRVIIVSFVIHIAWLSIYVVPRNSYKWLKCPDCRKGDYPHSIKHRK